MVTATDRAVATFDEKVRVAEERAGGPVNRMVTDIAKLDREGAVVAVHSTGFNMLDAVLPWRALGSDGPPKDLAVRVGSARVGLWPEKERNDIKAPVAQLYALHRKYGFRLTVTDLYSHTNARWMYWSGFDTFRVGAEAELARLEAARADSLERYDELRAQTVQSFVTLAQEAAERFNKMGAKLDANFVAAVVSELEAQIPSRESLQKRMQMSWEVSVIMLGSEDIAEQAKVLEIRAEMTDAQREQAVKDRVDRLKVEAEEERQDALSREHDVELARERRVKEEIRKLKVEAAKRQAEEIASPIREAGMQVRAQLHEDCRTMVESIRRNGYIHPSTAKKAGEMAEWFRVMNWTNDAEMETLISRLEQLAANPTKRKDAPTVHDFETALKEAVRLSAADARSLAKGRMQALEVLAPDAPTTRKPKVRKSERALEVV